MKLTKAQRALLQEAADFDGGMTISDTYAPAKKLVVLGLAKIEQMRLGGHLLMLTPAGRTALEASNDKV